MVLEQDPRHQLAQSKARDLAEQTSLGWAQLGLILVSLAFASVGIISYLKSQQYGTFYIGIVSLTADLFALTGFFLSVLR